MTDRYVERERYTHAYTYQPMNGWLGVHLCISLWQFVH